MGMARVEVRVRVRGMARVEVRDRVRLGLRLGIGLSRCRIFIAKFFFHLKHELVIHG